MKFAPRWSIRATRRANRRSRRKYAGKKGRKELIRIIKGVSLNTQETKKFFEARAASTDYPPIGSSNWDWCGNLWGQMPNLRNSGVRDENSYEGAVIHIKGIDLRIFIQDVGATLDATSRTVFRATIVSTTKAEDMVNPTGYGYVPTQWYEPLQSLIPPPFMCFNPDRVKVLWSKKFMGRPDATRSYASQIRHYQKFNRKFTKSEEHSLVTANYWGLNTGRDYFLILQGHKVNGSPIDTSNWRVTVNKTVYFKDA